MDAQEPAGGPASEPERDDEPQGVFGNLPRTRPGARSPRRDAEGREGGVRSSVAAEPDGDERGPRSGDPGPPGEEPDTGGGFEDVAWAGVAAAAEAATIGVRLANRALAAMRDAVDRR